MSLEKFRDRDSQAEIDKAVLEEREQCAIIALALIPEGGGSIVDGRRNHAHAIATKIRERGLKETGSGKMK